MNSSFEIKRCLSLKNRLQVAIRSLVKVNKSNQKMIFLQIPLQSRKEGIFKYSVKSVKKLCPVAYLCRKNLQEMKKAFTQSGFSSWNKAIERFKKHEKSDVHRFCLLHKTNLERGVNVHSMLSKSKLEDMKTARIALLKMISTLRFLMTGGLAIRGHEDEHSNYIRLLNLRSEDIPELKAWLQRSKYKWLSHDVTNELSSILSHEILRKIIKLVQNAVYYSVVIDETSDITNHEQVTFYFRYVDTNLNIHETFFGLYKTTSTTSENLFEIFNDVLRRFDINIKTCRGLCTDGAANVSGARTGLQTRIKAIEPRAIHVHCVAHSLNLVVQDTIKDVPAIRDFLALIRELIIFVRGSPKRQASKLYRQLMMPKSLLCGRFAQRDGVVQILSSQRTDEHFQKIWKSTVDLAHILELDEPKTPKIRVRPKRIDESSSEPHQFSSPADYY
nr:unnamed protein product [Callosobruchus chinensis]